MTPYEFGTPKTKRVGFKYAKLTFISRVPYYGINLTL